MTGILLWDARSASECSRLNPDDTWNYCELRFSIAYVIRKTAGKHALNTTITAQTHFTFTELNSFECRRLTR